MQCANRVVVGPNASFAQGCPFAKMLKPGVEMSLSSINQLAQKCPVFTMMKREQITFNPDLAKQFQTQCPFGQNMYEDRFESALDKLKKEKNYREFNNIHRDSSQFPYATRHPKIWDTRNLPPSHTAPLLSNVLQLSNVLVSWTNWTAWSPNNNKQ
eukprot:TRINITY_DN5544_c0_g1_i3.p1 TRINITY_DN5544_c0_g1~~TRINITY_DN5544_c0_g1_i3.p1  ORF type:complete len:179 (+),score=29.51 TRINITY_DN5544_c0_g1_i3:71-538(+)